MDNRDRWPNETIQGLTTVPDFNKGYADEMRKVSNSIAEMLGSTTAALEGFKLTTREASEAMGQAKTAMADFYAETRQFVQPKPEPRRENGKKSKKGGGSFCPSIKSQFKRRKAR